MVPHVALWMHVSVEPNGSKGRGGGIAAVQWYAIRRRMASDGERARCGVGDGRGGDRNCAEGRLPRISDNRPSRAMRFILCGVRPTRAGAAVAVWPCDCYEMEMDELFDRHLDEKEDEFDDGEIAEHAEEATQIGTAEGFEMATSLPPPPPPAPPFPPPPSADGEAVPPAETGEAEGDDGCLDRRKQQYSLDSFKTIRVIGKGSFGKVFLVREKTSGHIFAMKVLQKENIIKRNQVRVEMGGLLVESHVCAKGP